MEDNKLILLIAAVLTSGLLLATVLAGKTSTSGCRDFDRDGYSPKSGCGTLLDCNDKNPSIYPGATEICNDLVDQNCDGSVSCPCSDSDGGNNIYQAGYVKAYADQTYSDSCQSTYDIKEWYCEADGVHVGSQIQTCPSNYICSGFPGACVTGATTSTSVGSSTTIISNTTTTIASTTSTLTSSTTTSTVTNTTTSTSIGNSS